MTIPIPEGQWATIDAAIVANLIIPAIKEIKVLAHRNLSEALGIFYDRYAKLRAEVPERFVRSNRDYWRDFSTDGPSPPMAEPGTLPHLEDL
jgi:hypothetical protein